MMTFARIATAVLLAGLPLAAGAQTWTAVCSTGSVDEASLASFAFTGSTFRYLPSSSSVAPITERFNVTNTFDNSALGANFPLWTTLELGYSISAPTDLISASLLRVDPCTGVGTLVCTVSQLPGATCNVCTFPSSTLPIDFGKYLYYVLVTVDRASVADKPSCNTLRIY